jgi:hypothetical protein
MLIRKLKWALLPLIVMTWLMVRYGSWWQAPDIGTGVEAVLNVAFEAFLTGLPILLPAIHLWRILATAGKRAGGRRH